MNPQEQKAELRREFLEIRDGLELDLRVEKSLQAAAQSVASFEFEPGTIVSGFFPIRSEIDPRPLMDDLRKKGAQLCLPIVIDKTTIIFRELVRGAELVDTGFGTRGPNEDARVLEPQVMIIPLSVFDMSGGRIGYGAGHYDRAIERLIDKGESPKLIGMAFDCQCAKQVPVEPHDKRLEAMITESGFHKIKAH